MQEVRTHPTTYPHTSWQVEGRNYTAHLMPSCEDAGFYSLSDGSVFQTRSYHAALEEAPPQNMTFWYVRLEEDGQPIGMLTFQISLFNPGVSLQKHGRRNLIERLRYKVASLIKLRVLCLGNTTLTGDYGFCFSNEIPHRVQTLLMMQTIDWLLTLPPFKGVGLVFVKDFYHDIFEELQHHRFCKKYHFIDTQPSMMMDIPTEWKSLDGYLQSLKSKYRVRAKKAISSAACLERAELNADEIEAIEPQLHRLYLNVVEDVGFNLFILSPAYFSTMKRELGDAFRLWIYKDKGEMIAFFTVFEDGDVLDAHFLGYEQEINHTFKLYMNMLLSMIGEAASRGFRQLQLSRTATEIKSSVGAEGVPMWAYLRFPNRILNGFLPFVYSFFKPNLDWVPRDPFHQA